MIKKLFTHSLVYGLGPFVPKIVGLLMLPIFTSVLSAEDYGVQALLNSSMGLIGVLGMLGLQLPLTNLFYKHTYHYKKQWSQFYGFLNIWMVFYAILLAIIIYFIVPVEARDNVYWIVALNVIPIVFFGPTATIGQVYYQLNQKPTQIISRTIGIAFLTIGLNYYTIVILNLHYMGWFISNCIATMLLNLSYWYSLRYKLNIRPIYGFKKYVILRGLNVSLPMIPHYYGSFLIGSADSLLLKFFLISTAQIGFYGFASSFGGIMAMAVGAINTAAGPILYEQIKYKNYIAVRNLTWIVQFLLLVLVSIGCIWMKELFGYIVKNEALKETYFLTIVFVMAHNYRPMYFGVATILFYRERTRNLWKVTFGAGLFCVLANLVSIPFFGFQSPAFVLFFSYLIMGYGTFFLKDYKEVAIIDFKPFIWFFVTVLSFLLVLLINNLLFNYKLLISILYLMTIPLFFYKIKYFYTFKKK